MGKSGETETAAPLKAEALTLRSTRPHLAQNALPWAETNEIQQVAEFRKMSVK